MADIGDIADELTHHPPGEQLHLPLLNTGVQCVDGFLELLYCIHNVIYIVCLFSIGNRRNLTAAAGKAY